jgi:hypothetical protein
MTRRLRTPVAHAMSVRPVLVGVGSARSSASHGLARRQPSIPETDPNFPPPRHHPRLGACARGVDVACCRRPPCSPEGQPRRAAMGLSSNPRPRQPRLRRRPAPARRRRGSLAATHPRTHPISGCACGDLPREEMGGSVSTGTTRFSAQKGRPPGRCIPGGRAMGA